MERSEILDSGSVAVLSSIHDSHQTRVLFAWKVLKYSELKKDVLYFMSSDKDGNSWTFRLMRTKHILFLSLHTNFVKKSVKFLFADDDRKLECSAVEIVDGLYAADVCIKMISDAGTGFLDDGTLTIYCVHDLATPNPTWTVVPYGQWRYKTCVDDLLEVMNNLFRSSQASDLILKAEDEEFRVHKIILAARSKYFARLFEMENITEHRIEAGANAVREVLRYIYTAKVQEKEVDDMIEVLHMAKEFEITGLAQKCVEFLKANLSYLTVPPIFDIAKEYNMKDLLREVMDYFAENRCKYRNNQILKDFKRKIYLYSQELQETENP